MPVEPPLQNDFDEELRELWQGQKLEGGRMSIEAIHSKARAFERNIRWRNALEYIAAVIVVVSFTLQVFEVDENVFIRTGSGLIVLATLFVVHFLHKRGSAKTMPDEMGRTASFGFHRASLERQRDLLLSVWRWYLLPFVPGLLVDFIGFAVRDGVLQPSEAGIQTLPTLKLVAVGSFVVGIFLIIAALNKRNAGKLQAQIDALEERSI